MITLTSPTVARIEIPEGKLSDLKKVLQYHDKKVDFEIRRIKNSSYELQRLGVEGVEEVLAELKKQRIKSLLFEDEQGYWTYSGMASRLAARYRCEILRKYSIPEPKSIPWLHKPAHTPRPYQLEMNQKLIEATHGGVEVATGLGKTFSFILLLKHYGLKSVIGVPSVSIATQVYDELVHYFGKKYVGLVGDGKKDFKKLFVVAVNASLVRAEEGTPLWEALSGAQVFISDESHMTPAVTLQKVCFGLLANAPLRFFFSATQIRGDGLEPVLEAITGDLVFKMSLRDGVEQGYLARPYFHMVHLDSKSRYDGPDIGRLTREHIYANKAINKHAADLANKTVSLLGQQVVILIDEIPQFTALLPHLKHKVGFAHGGVTKDNRDKIPEAYHKSDVKQLVADFNAGKLQILIGTSCVSTGTDIRPVGHIINLVGNKSETQLTQGIGRGTRKVEGKTSFHFTDYQVDGVDTLERHAAARVAIYEQLFEAPDHIYPKASP